MIFTRCTRIHILGNHHKREQFIISKTSATYQNIIDSYKFEVAFYMLYEKSHAAAILQWATTPLMGHVPNGWLATLLPSEILNYKLILTTMVCTSIFYCAQSIAFKARNCIHWKITGVRCTFFSICIEAGSGLNSPVCAPTETYLQLVIYKNAPLVCSTLHNRTCGKESRAMGAIWVRCRGQSPNTLGPPSKTRGCLY